jgi:hypothetical protein
MSEQTLPLPPSFFRWLQAPAFLGVIVALFSALAARIRHHARQPAVARMSDQWLRTHDAHSSHSGEFWRESYW